MSTWSELQAQVFLGLKHTLRFLNGIMHPAATPEFSI